ncbi:MAG: GNAT family N-acetyltransferase [Pseudomonadota bacterium]
MVEPYGILRIRTAQARDAMAIARMANSLAQATGSGPGAMTAAAVIRDLIEADGLTPIVAVRGRDVLGYALYSTDYETAHAARGLYVADLYVEEAVRGTGIARALMQELARRCLADGGRFLWWMVMDTNETAQGFYDRLGATRDAVSARAVFDAPFEALLANPAREAKA